MFSLVFLFLCNVFGNEEVHPYHFCYAEIEYNADNEIFEASMDFSTHDLEAIYNSAVSYFDINKRMSVLNKRLDTMSDLLMLLSEELKYRSGERTDRIITALIFIEVLIAIIEFTFFKFK